MTKFAEARVAVEQWAAEMAKLDEAKLPRESASGCRNAAISWDKDHLAARNQNSKRTSASQDNRELTGAVNMERAQASMKIASAMQTMNSSGKAVRRCRMGTKSAKGHLDFSNVFR